MGLDQGDQHAQAIQGIGDHQFTAGDRGQDQRGHGYGGGPGFFRAQGLSPQQVRDTVIHVRQRLVYA